MAMRECLLAVVLMTGLTSGFAYAASTNDEVFANAALRGLHNLAVARVQFEQAYQDSDDVGCRDAYERIQNAGHEALMNMHYMSFAPIDAIADVSSLLRVSHLTPDECANEVISGMNMLLITAGQAIMSLRYDYAVGDHEWYIVDPNGRTETKNPLQYAQSLKDEDYSWVSLRPKGMIFMLESDWKAEMESDEVDDPSIENSGSNLNAVEVDYRKNPDDHTTVVYLYRTQQDAVAAALAAKKQAESDAKADAELTASDAEWRRKLTSLPYAIATDDPGFKLVYAVCKPADKSATTENTCSEDDSHDWSDNPHVPYHWFGDKQACEEEEVSIHRKPPADVKIASDDVLTSNCVPAPKVSKHAMTGYKMVLALSGPGADIEDDAYADLRASGSRIPVVFRTFKECYDETKVVYAKIPGDLGVDKDGNLLSDRGKSITMVAICVRTY
jgi:hypothetical protein